ncbi:MAG TPA: universal stress protein [Prolixibacteraceae bacterium]|nr:universal stress protein [Prolixibacteraceae bacterium]
MRHRLHDVLVLVPLTDEGKIVLKQAMCFRNVLGCRVFVLNVISPVSFFKRQFNPLKVKGLIDEALLKLTEFVQDFFEGKIPEEVILKVSMGNLVSTLIKQARSDDFLFLILKRSMHRKGVSNLLEQNEIDKIIGHSYCPVLSINEDSTQRDLKTILIPVDIAEGATKKLLWASMFAKKAHAKILIISALNINIDEQKSLALKNAEKMKFMLSERGIECDLEILKVYGQVKHEMVLSYIATQKPDLIIIRKHHVASSLKTTIGDFAKEIIHGSNVPVFTVSQTQIDIADILS